MRKLVSNHRGHDVLRDDRVIGRVEQQVLLPVRDQAPVLHSASIEIRDGDLG